MCSGDHRLVTVGAPARYRQRMTLRRSLPVLLLVLAVVGTGCTPRLPFIQGAERRAVRSLDCRIVNASDLRLPTRPGIAIVPTEGAQAAARMAAADLRRDVSAPVTVTAPVRLDPSECHAPSGQLQFESVVTAFARHTAAGDRLTIVILAHDVRSEEFGWIFGGWNAGFGLGIVSSARMGQFPGASTPADAARRRLAVFVRRYALLIWFDAVERVTDPDTSLLSPKFSFSQLDATRDDLCRHRDSVRAHPTTLRRCPVLPIVQNTRAPSGVTVQQRATRSAVAEACAAYGDAIRQTATFDAADAGGMRAQVARTFGEAVERADLAEADTGSERRIVAASRVLEAAHADGDARALQRAIATIDRTARQLDIPRCLATRRPAR